MNNFSNIDRRRLCLIICLESIQIENKANILSKTSQKFKDLNNNFYITILFKTKQMY